MWFLMNHRGEATLLDNWSYLWFSPWLSFHKFITKDRILYIAGGTFLNSRVTMGLKHKPLSERTNVMTGSIGTSPFACLQYSSHHWHWLLHRVQVIENLRQDLQVSHNTVSRWLDILETLYICYRISPFNHSRIRAVRKEKKLYLWGWAQMSCPGARFENMVASQLLKYRHFMEDTEGYRMNLQYIRDRDGREVDFVVVKDSQPLFAVECKVSDRTISKAIKYFKERTNILEFYQVHLGHRDIGSTNRDSHCLPFWKFCQIKQMP